MGALQDPLDHLPQPAGLPPAEVAAASRGEASPRSTIHRRRCCRRRRRRADRAGSPSGCARFSPGPRASRLDRRRTVPDQAAARRSRRRCPRGCVPHGAAEPADVAKTQLVDAVVEREDQVSVILPGFIVGGDDELARHAEVDDQPWPLEIEQDPLPRARRHGRDGRQPGLPARRPFPPQRLPTDLKRGEAANRRAADAGRAPRFRPRAIRARRDSPCRL